MLSALKQVIEKTKDAKRYDAIARDDNEALADKINDEALCGNHGLNSAVSMTLEVRRLKSTCESIKAKCAKGHQEPASCSESPEAHLNNKCDCFANQEREDKNVELSVFDLHPNTAAMQNNERLMGRAKKELDLQLQNGILQECWMNRGLY